MYNSKLSKLYLINAIRNFCFYLYYMWYKRKHECNESLTLDIEYYLTLDEEQKQVYLDNLVNRRKLAHKKGLYK